MEIEVGTASTLGRCGECTRRGEDLKVMQVSLKTGMMFRLCAACYAKLVSCLMLEITQTQGVTFRETKTTPA